jgi:hypothetical protein
MNHEDAEVSDITVILKKDCADKFDQSVTELRKLQMTIEETDEENGVVTGTVGADKLPHIRASPCVEYVRVDFTYVADYPPGDARNQDPPDKGDDGED